ncbi:MAG: OB-fold nucleic acid binding domain-containing protein, partial [Steroidobacteraceae bacterium]|nr:OB-fold nucleic acid binding domain-containing protein [Steroidobacteraceae bacterium]MDW8259098.1 OB-fold nucleic acid binding domain-containing protein [Gammaproteobacteria bacterium]
MSSIAATAQAREQRPVTALRGVGPQLAERLRALGVERIQDLLFILPARYEDRTTITPIGAMRPGERRVLEGEVQLTEVVFRRRRQMLTRISDGTGSITLRFFYFSSAQQRGLARGTRVRVHGEVRRGPAGLEIVHPQYRLLPPDRPVPLEETLTPIYPLTAGIPQGRLRGLILQALGELAAAGVRDWIPPEVLGSLHLPGLARALEYVHRPPRESRLAELLAGTHPAQQRLAFEELLAHQLALRLLKARIQREQAWPLRDTGGLVERLIAALPFRETSAQSRVRREIEADLEREFP